MIVPLLADAARTEREMLFFTQQVKKIKKKAKKLEIEYEVAVEKGATLRAARIKKSYLALAKKHPKLIR